MKSTDAEFDKSLSTSLAFASKLEYYALLSRDLGFFETDVHSGYEAAIIEVKKRTNKFRQQLKEE